MVDRSISRTRKVGAGSREQDLVGDVIMRRTSAGVHGRNDDSVDGVLDMTSGAGRSAVARRITSVVLKKYAERTRRQCDWWRRGRCSYGQAGSRN